MMYEGEPNSDVVENTLMHYTVVLTSGIPEAAIKLRTGAIKMCPRLKRVSLVDILKHKSAITRTEPDPRKLLIAQMVDRLRGLKGDPIPEKCDPVPPPGWFSVPSAHPRMPAAGLKACPVVTENDPEVRFFLADTQVMQLNAVLSQVELSAVNYNFDKYMFLPIAFSDKASVVDIATYYNARYTVYAAESSTTLWWPQLNSLHLGMIKPQNAPRDDEISKEFLRRIEKGSGGGSTAGSNSWLSSGMKFATDLLMLI